METRPLSICLPSADSTFTAWFGFSDPADVASLPLLVLLFSAYFLLAQPIALAYSRHIERAADRVEALDAQDVLPAVAGREEQLDAVGEEEQADPVVVADRGEREHGRELLSELPCRESTPAEQDAARHADERAIAGMGRCSWWSATPRGWSWSHPCALWRRRR